MNYDAELQFFTNIMKNLQLPVKLIKPPYEHPTDIDSGLRNLFMKEKNAEDIMLEFQSTYQPNTIYRVYDEYLCNYIILRLPETNEPEFLVIGPYTLHGVSKQMILKLAEIFAIPHNIFPQLEKYYQNLSPLPNETRFLALVNTFGERIWGGIDNFSLQDVDSLFSMKSDTFRREPNYDNSEENFLSIQILEERYALENEFIHAISQGQTHKAEMFMNNMNSKGLESRTSNPIRNLKNYTIILNTLLRKAAETGAVHPIHLDSLSSRYAKEIELLTSEKSALALQREMVHKYCLLVKNHSLKGYSLLVRKVLTNIDTDLTADLSLKTQAEFLNVNPSYLSNLFKKETGQTLTEYVNRKRIEYAIYLLNSTNMQVQMIAGYCGILDVNYFTKIFKKIVGMTPKEYRDRLRTYR